MTTEESLNPANSTAKQYGATAASGGAEAADHSAVAVGGGDGGSSSRAIPSCRATCCKYGVFLFMGLLICLILRDHHVQEFMRHMPGIKDKCDDARCYGTQSVFRISFSLVMFFSVHFLMACSWNLCMEPETRVGFQTVGMIWKAPVFIVTLVVSFMIPNSFFVGYGYFALVATILFLLCQILVLIDFAYEWNEDWTSKAEKCDDPTHNKWIYGLLLSVLALFTGSFLILGFSYKWFPCELGKTFTSLTLILNIFATLVALRVPHGSIVPSSLVFVYNTALAFSAQQNLHGTCNHLAGTSSSTHEILTVIINVVFCMVSLTYSAMSTAHSRGTFTLSTAVEDAEDVSKPYAYFHAMMVLASAYLAMLMSSWNITGFDHGHDAHADLNSSVTAMWVKMACSWTTFLLYLWTLIAPVLFPDRFGGNDVLM